MKEKINLVNFTNDPRGAVTVEYAIIFPIVIICILLLIYLGVLYYQQCLMQTVVSENVQSLALLWGYELDGADVKTGITSKDAYISEKLYWHIAQETNEKKIKAAQSIQNEIMLKSIIKPQNDFEVEVIYSNSLISKKVGISAKAEYPLPFKSFFKLIGSSGYVLIDTYSETVINAPKDFIQNIDYLLQIYEESGAKGWVQEKCEPLVNALQAVKNYFK